MTYDDLHEDSVNLAQYRDLPELGQWAELPDLPVRPARAAQYAERAAQLLRTARDGDPDEFALAMQDHARELLLRAAALCGSPASQVAAAESSSAAPCPSPAADAR